MKALKIISYGKIEDSLEFQDEAIPEVGVSDVLIDIHAVSTNPIDYKIIEGNFKQVIPLSFPAPIGFDVSGKIIKKGDNVTHLNIGDEVFSRVPSERFGTFAEQIAVKADVVVKKPNNISFEEAAGIPLVGLTGLQSLNQGKIKEGDRVLIHAGSGGVGSFSIQYAKSKGAYVYTTTSTDNVDWVKALGADRVIDYKKENYLDIAKEMDIIFDTLGGQYTLDAFKILKNNGWVISSVGEVDGETAKELGLNGFIRFILSLKMQKIKKEMKKKNAGYKLILMQPSGEQLTEIKLLIEKGKIKPVVDRTFSFENSMDALKLQASGRAKGKIIINIKG